MSWILGLRNRHFFALDIMILLFIPVLAISMRLESLGWWPESGRALIVFALTAVTVKLFIFYRHGLYGRYWRFASVNELVDIALAVGIATASLTVIFVSAHRFLEPLGLAMYRTVPLIDGLLTFVAIGGLRFGIRGLYQRRRLGHVVSGGRRVLIMGAGEAGILCVREMHANPQLNMEPVVFADDDAAKQGMSMQGVPVLGTSRDIHRLVDQYHIQRIIVALPSVPLVRRLEIIDVCKKTGVATYSVPGIYEILAGNKTISPLPSIDINRLLQREPVVTDQAEVEACLAGATILVTGAGGSIGSELCRQLARFGPKTLILLGHGENSIFEIDMDLRMSFPDLTIYPVIADIRDERRILTIVGRYRPDVIFHAAAHKHVPYMQLEINTEEAIANNVIGTYNVLQAAELHQVQRFVFISTDKAIKPTSIMGTTKRLAELLVVDAAHRTGRPYLAVRFGNVLGSRGSVIPVFQRQIAAGGPVTVTHPDMSRYFMTIPEAVQLVLQATALGQGGEVFVLDMGEPVRILDLATNIIRLSGLEPGRDIKIEFSGMRPGEKLTEELFFEDEQRKRTKHQSIFVAANGNGVEAATVARLVKLAKQMQTTSAPKEALVPDRPLSGPFLWPEALTVSLNSQGVNAAD